MSLLMDALKKADEAKETKQEVNWPSFDSDLISSNNEENEKEEWLLEEINDNDTTEMISPNHSDQTSNLFFNNKEPDLLEEFQDENIQTEEVTPGFDRKEEFSSISWSPREQTFAHLTEETEDELSKHTWDEQEFLPEFQNNEDKSEFTIEKDKTEMVDNQPKFATPITNQNVDDSGPSKKKLSENQNNDDSNLLMEEPSHLEKKYREKEEVSHLEKKDREVELAQQATTAYVPKQTFNFSPWDEEKVHPDLGKKRHSKPVTPPQIHKERPLENWAADSPQPEAAQRVLAAGNFSSSSRTLLWSSLLGLLIVGIGIGYYYYDQYLTSSPPLKLGQFNRQMAADPPSQPSSNRIEPAKLQSATNPPELNSRSTSTPPSEPNPSSTPSPSAPSSSPLVPEETPSVAAADTTGKLSTPKEHSSLSTVHNESSTSAVHNESSTQTNFLSTAQSMVTHIAQKIVKSEAPPINQSTQSEETVPETNSKTEKPLRLTKSSSQQESAQRKPVSPAPSTNKELSTKSVSSLTAGIQTLHKSIDQQLNIELSNGYSAFQRGDDKAAQQAYQRALQQDQTNRDALLGLAAVTLRSGNVLQAQQYYQQVLHWYPQDTLAKVGLMNTLDNLSSESESQLKLLLEQAPQSAYIHFSLGNLYASQQRWAQAQQAYFEAYRYESNQADYAYNLAVSLDHLNQPRLALTYYQKTLQLVNNQPVHFNPQTVRQRVQTLLTYTHANALANLPAETF